MMSRRIGDGFPDSESAKEAVQRYGYYRMGGAEFKLSRDLREGLARLTALQLPGDANDRTGNRFRRYGKAWIVPGGDRLHVSPTVMNTSIGEREQEYYQPVSLNPEEQGKTRRFAALDEEHFENSLLRALIRFDLSITEFSPDRIGCPLQVGVHIISLRAREGVPAAATPDFVHCDGEHYTFAHLLMREGVVGGKNWVTDRSARGKKTVELSPSEVKASFTLDEPLDCYVVKDDLVAHAVDKVSVAEGHQEGHRTILLIDFTPMLPVLQL